MRKPTILLAAMALLFASCQKPELVGPAEENPLFDASVEAFNVPTKTSLTQDSRVVWSSDDRLAIFQGSTAGDEYKLVGLSAGSSNGSFDIISDNSSNNSVTSLPCNVAYYPYASGMKLSGTMDGNEAAYILSNVVLPATQKYAANSFANGAFPMIAVTSSVADHGLKFKNILGAMKVSLKGTAVVKSIKIESLNGEKLSGAATVTAYAENLKPVIKMSNEASIAVTLDCGDGVQLKESESEDFYIALPPVSFENGFKMIVKDADGYSYTKTASKGIVVLRSSILLTPELTLPEADPVIIYSNDFDRTLAQTGGNWPILGNFDGWMNETGTGAADVTYSYSGTDVRNNDYSNGSNSHYPGSGGNNIFFGKSEYFAVHNIDVSGAKNISMTFGTKKNGVFTSSQFHIYLSNDGGEKWVELTEYTFAGGATSSRWNVASALFSLPEGATSLSVCFIVDEYSYRLDDLKLESVSTKGTPVDFTSAVEKSFSTGGSGSDDGGDTGGDDGNDDGGNTGGDGGNDDGDDTGGNTGGGSGSASDPNLLYSNDFDKTLAEKNGSWPYLKNFDGWRNETGTGASYVTYSYNDGMSVRSNLPSNDTNSYYPGSGGNNIFFGKSAYFAVNNIDVSGAKNISMTLLSHCGGEYTLSDFNIHISKDGEKWVQLSYKITCVDTCNSRWVATSALFTLPEGTTTLYVRFKANVDSKYRIDDLKLESVSTEGTAVRF